MAYLAVDLMVDLDTALYGWSAIPVNDRGDGILRECCCLVFLRLDGLVSLPLIICEANEYMATT